MVTPDVANPGEGPVMSLSKIPCASIEEPATPHELPLTAHGGPSESRTSPFAQRFASIVSLLMQDAEYRQIRLADLEWLVIPPILAGQCRLAHAPPVGKSGAKTGLFFPVAVALWASVSDETDTCLSAIHGGPVLLKPNEWTTGNHLWLQAVAGNRRAIPTFLGQLEAQDFRGKSVKVRARARDGTMEVLTLAAYRERMAASLAQTKLN